MKVVFVLALFIAVSAAAAVADLAAEEEPVVDGLTDAEIIAKGCRYIVAKILELKGLADQGEIADAEEYQKQKRDLTALVDYFVKLFTERKIHKSLLLGLADCGLDEFCEALSCPLWVKTSLSYLTSLRSFIETYL